MSRRPVGDARSGMSGHSVRAARSPTRLACDHARSVVLIAICALAPACGESRSEPAEGDRPDPVVGAPDGSPGDAAGAGVEGAAGGAVPASCEDLHATMLAVSPTRQALAAEFGAPDSIARGAEPNRHDPAAVDSLFTVFYPGLVLDIRTPAGARDMATHVRVEENRYLAYPGIGIDAPSTKVEETLGPPHERSPDALTYQCGTEVEQPVMFIVADGRVRAVEISWYVD